MTVTVNDENLSATPDAGGVWAVTPFGLLENGTYEVVASVIDGAGNTGSFTQELEVDTELPIVIIAGGPAVITNDLTPTISGSTDIAAGQLVTVTMVRGDPSANFTRTTLVQTDGTWNITPNMLTAGEWTVTATVTDPAGNENFTAQTLDIDVAPPVAAIDGGVAALTNDPTPTITGSAVEATVTVRLDGQALADVEQDSDQWAVTYAGSTLGDGNHHVSMTATDLAGNSTTVVQTLTVDTGLPEIAINPGPDDATNDRTPTISGTTDVAPGAGVTVSVVIDAAPPMVALVQAGGWNITPSAELDLGSHTVVASVVDRAGNVGTSTQTLTIDTTPPSITIDGGASRTTPDSTPTITGGSVDVAVGSAVTVTFDSQTLSTTIGDGGTWAVTAAAIANDTYVVDVRVTDAAGNVGHDSQSLTINAITPTVSFSNGATATTNDATPLIGGSTTATVGSAVVVLVNGQTLRASVQPGGSWNVTAAHIADGTYTVVMTVNPVDERSGTASQSLTIQTTVPVTPPTIPPTTPPTIPPTTPPTIPPTTPPSTPPGQGAGFASVGPKRVFDTRAGESPNALRSVVKQQVGGGYVLRVQMAGLGGYVPASGVGAVSLNVTSTGSTVAGFITVYACGTRELVASVNFPAGGTVANAVVAPVSTDGDVCFYANAPTDIVVDINGWFATGAAFTAVGPKRVFDTRADNSPDALRAVTKAAIAAGEMIEVRLTDLNGYVPADGVGSVSLNIAVTNPQGGRVHHRVLVWHPCAGVEPQLRRRSDSCQCGHRSGLGGGHRLLLLVGDDRLDRRHQRLDTGRLRIHRRQSGSRASTPVPARATTPSVSSRRPRSAAVTCSK